VKIEDFFNPTNILDLSFFNFSNAITAAYFANDELEIQRVNDNFKAFFPILGNVTNVYFPDVLERIGLPGDQIDEFVRDIQSKGSVLIPEIEIRIDGATRVYSLLSTRTSNDAFSQLNGVQGQFVDRTAETQLRREREELINQRLRDQGVIEEKSQQLENLASRLAKYLSPQVYQSLFTNTQSDGQGHQRKNLTVFFSDIEGFTDMTEMVAPERLARIINSYLSEMTTIAIECGGTIDKFIGDAVMVFFGDPTTDGETEDAIKCVEMALRMQSRVAELRKHWERLGVPRQLTVRMGIATGYCTVGNFGCQSALNVAPLSACNLDPLDTNGSSSR
jgi:adenylate cyclase